MIDRYDGRGDLIVALGGALIAALVVGGVRPTMGNTWVHPERADQPSQEIHSHKRPGSPRRTMRLATTSTPEGSSGSSIGVSTGPGMVPGGGHRVSTGGGVEPPVRPVKPPQVFGSRSQLNGCRTPRRIDFPLLQEPQRTMYTSVGPLHPPHFYWNRYGGYPIQALEVGRSRRFRCDGFASRRGCRNRQTRD